MPVKQNRHVRPFVKTPNPYSGPGTRALSLAWQEGYDAGRIDDRCTNSRNEGRHCKHWQEGDGDCCDCDKPCDVFEE